MVSNNNDAIIDLISELNRKYTNELHIWWLINVLKTKYSDIEITYGLNRYQIGRINKKIYKRIKNDKRYLDMVRKSNSIS